jgi:MFS transporter, DHA1 family, tetracycline resistance protein
MLEKKHVVFPLFFVILIDSLGLGIAFPVLEPLVLHNVTHLFSPAVSVPMRRFLYELSLAVYCLFMFLMSPLLGSWSDKYGRKNILITSMFGNFLGFFVAGLAIYSRSFLGILLGRAIAGATAGSLPIAQAAIMDISHESKKASRLGLLVLANVAGVAMGPLIGGLFLDHAFFSHVHYPLPFLVSASGALVGMIWVMLAFKETFSGDKHLKIHVFTGFSNLYTAFSHKKTLVYCASFFLFLLGWGMFFALIPVFLSEKFGWEASSIGFFIAYMMVFFAFMVTVVIPYISKRFDLHSMVALGLAVLFICCMFFSFISSSKAVCLWVLLTMAVPVIYVGLVTLLSMQVSDQEQGQIMGVAGSIFAFTWGVGPLLVGALLDSGLRPPYFAAGFFLFLAASGVMLKVYRLKKAYAIQV